MEPIHLPVALVSNARQVMKLMPETQLVRLAQMEPIRRQVVPAPSAHQGFPMLDTQLVRQMMIFSQVRWSKDLLFTSRTDVPETGVIGRRHIAKSSRLI